MPLTLVKQIKKFPQFDIFKENKDAVDGREGWANWTRIMWVKGTAVYMAGFDLPNEELVQIMVTR